MLASALVFAVLAADGGVPRLEIRAATKPVDPVKLPLVEGLVVDRGDRDYREIVCEGRFTYEGFEHQVTFRGPAWSGAPLSAWVAGPLLDVRWLAAPRKLSLSCSSDDLAAGGKRLTWSGELALPGAAPGTGDARVAGITRDGQVAKVQTAVAGAPGQARTVTCVHFTRLPGPVPPELAGLPGITQRTFSTVRTETRDDTLEVALAAVPVASTLHCSVVLGPAHEATRDAAPGNDVGTLAVPAVPFAPGGDSIALRGLPATGVATSVCNTCDHLPMGPPGRSMRVPVRVEKGAWPLFVCTSTQQAVPLTWGTAWPATERFDGDQTFFAPSEERPSPFTQFVGPPAGVLDLTCTAWSLPDFKKLGVLKKKVKFNAR